VNVIMPPSLATVFSNAKEFNGDLSSWDVSRVTNMDYSKLCALFVSAMIAMRTSCVTCVGFECIRPLTLALTLNLASSVTLTATLNIKMTLTLTPDPGPKPPL
jgi:surface protein